MQITGNTILITGGSSGIGRALAEAFHKLGNQVIVAGRRKALLDEVTAANPGMASAVLDVANLDSLAPFAADLIREFPALNVLINNAGIMKNENLADGSNNTAIADETVNTNLLSVFRLTAALLPHFQKQPHAAVMTVSSGLAFVPMAVTPTYCATKAAIHSWTQSLRYQLRRDFGRSARTGAALCANGTAGPAPGDRPAGHASRRFHRGGHGDPARPARREGNPGPASIRCGSQRKRGRRPTKSSSPA